MQKLALVLSLAFGLHGQAAADTVDFLKCGSCEAWNKAQKPFNVVGNTWYVGTAELSALLVTSPKGHILLDGALPQSAPLIAANIQALGFKLEDVKLILNSHAHWDHAGGIAALQKLTGATVAASKHGAQVLRDGTIGKDDAQYDAKKPTFITPVKQVRDVADGETVRVGDLAITAHLTPGHTPGSTAWTWKSCVGAKCHDIVYADSLTAVSMEGYKFTPMADTFRSSIARVAALPCDVAISTHPGFTDVQGKLKRGNFIDPNSCKDYAATALKNFEARIARERAQ
jgi:metallo-beta-lactamase class B